MDAEPKFYIVTGKDYDIYLQVNPFGEDEDGINILSGVKDKREASFFRVEKSGDKYLLAFDHDKGTMYMARTHPDQIFSLQMGKGEAAEFTLHDPKADDATSDLETWKIKPCYLKIGSGYGAYDTDEKAFEFIEESEDEESYWRHCRLEEPEVGGDGMRAPKGPNPGIKNVIFRENVERLKIPEFGDERKGLKRDRSTAAEKEQEKAKKKRREAKKYGTK